MAKLKKICKIQGYTEKGILEVLRILEEQGFIVVDDNPFELCWKTYRILKET